MMMMMMLTGVAVLMWGVYIGVLMEKERRADADEALRSAIRDRVQDSREQLVAYSKELDDEK